MGYKIHFYDGLVLFFIVLVLECEDLVLYNMRDEKI